jgi:hypothetical protein
MSPADVNNVLLSLTGVLVVLTAVVTWFASQTVRESRKATTAIKETVVESTKATEAVQSLLTVAKDTASWSAKSVAAAEQTVAASEELLAAVQSLLTVAKDTASWSAKSVAAAEQTVAASEELLASARETIKVAHAARASDVHDRKVHQLRDIGQLAESLFWKAVRDAEVKPTLHGWRMIEHNYLEQALVGMTEALPKTVMLTQTNNPDAAIGAARDARVEIVQALNELKRAAS